MDDRFVARRGSQGDDWHWETSAPAPAHAERREGPPPGRRLRSTAAATAAGTKRWAGALAALLAPPMHATTAAAQRLGTWVASVIESLGAKPAKPRPQAPPPPPPDATTVQAEAPIQAGERPARLRGLLPRSRIAIPWSKIALPRPRVRLTPPRLPVRRPHWTAPRLRPRLSLPAIALPKIPKEAQAPLALFAGLGLALVLAIAAVILVDVLDDDDGGGGGIVGGVTKTPLETPPGSETPTDGGNGEETPAPSETEEPTAAPPSPTPAITPTVPVEEPAFAFWANKQSAWWFDSLSGDVAEYEEGQYLPFMARWDGEAGRTYNVTITYDCATEDAFGAIDYLSGIEQWGREPVYAEYGPARDAPDAAIPVPDTEDFPLDDDDPGVLTLYGATFSLLPSPPSPPENCGLQRTIIFPVRALGGTVTLLGSAHLAMASEWGQDEGASSHDPPFGMRVTVEGLGNAQAVVFNSAIADIAH